MIRATVSRLARYLEDKDYPALAETLYASAYSLSRKSSSTMPIVTVWQRSADAMIDQIAHLQRGLCPSRIFYDSFIMAYAACVRINALGIKCVICAPEDVRVDRLPNLFDRQMIVESRYWKASHFGVPSREVSADVYVLMPPDDSVIKASLDMGLPFGFLECRPQNDNISTWFELMGIELKIRDTTTFLGMNNFLKHVRSLADDPTSVETASFMKSIVLLNFWAVLECSESSVLVDLKKAFSSLNNPVRDPVQ